jgi:hypothetical protein
VGVGVRDEKREKRKTKDFVEADGEFYNHSKDEEKKCMRKKIPKHWTSK